MISRKLGSLCGKLARDGKNDWLPLWIHLADTGEIAKCLWIMGITDVELKNLRIRGVKAEGIRQLLVDTYL